MPIRCNLLWAAILFLLSFSLGQATQTLRVELEDRAPVEVSMQSFYDAHPQSGFSPILVTLRNKSESPHVFRLSYRSGAAYGGGTIVTGEFVLPVDGSGRSQTWLYIPVLNDQNNYQRISLRLSGPGVKSGEIPMDSSSYGYSDSAFTGMGERFGRSYRSEIEEKHSGKSDKLKVTVLDPATMPADWRAYVAFSSIWLTASDWDRCEAGVRAAIIERLGLGGCILNFVTTSPDQRATLNLPGATPAEDGKTWNLGLGKIRYFTHPVGKPDAFTRQAAEALQADRGIASLLSGRHGGGGYQHGWKLSDKVEKLGQHVLILSISMLIFAGIIGPLNFLVFAPAACRHRILWTTPLIALVASLLLAVIILISDGIGGRGARIVVACLMPDQNRIVLHQEQISRSGLLLGKRFAFPADAELEPIKIPDMREQGAYSHGGDAWEGDWFSSRARQAQYASTIRPAHGGIRVVVSGNGERQVISSLETPLSVLYLSDDQGVITARATDLQPGVRRPLENVSKSKMEELASLAELGGSVISERWQDGQSRVRWFYALAEKPADLALATLPSIKWTTDVALIIGPAEITRE